MLLKSRLFRRVLKSLHPEVTYRTSHLVLKIVQYVIPHTHSSHLPETRLFNIRLAPPVGLGAGIDKDGELILLADKLGLGFHVVGSVLLGRRRGNRHPRLYRYVDRLCMINAMGLPSKGVHNVLLNIGLQCRHTRSVRVFVNIAGFSIDEFAALSKILNSIEEVKLIELNISCPQYRGVDLHEPERLRELLQRVREVTQKPLLVKIRPRLTYTQLKTIIKVCEEFSNIGLTVANSFQTSARFLSSGVGGVSGLPIYKLTCRLIDAVRRVSDIPIVACGGIFSGRQVYELLTKFNVCAVQIVTAFAYEGPLAIRRILEELECLYK